MALTRPTIAFDVSYGTDAWAAPTWTDEHEYLRSFKCKRGRQHELQAFDAGTSTLVLLNNSRRFDPNWPAGPLGGELLPGVRYRIRATWAGITYPILHNWAERWEPQRPKPAWSNTVLTGVDSFKRLRKKKLNTPGYRDAVIADGPLAYYRLAETQGTVAVDSSGNGLDGSYVQGGFWTGGNPKLGQESSLLSDPQDKSLDTDVIWSPAEARFRPQGYLQLPDAAALTGAGAISVEVWFKTTSNDTDFRTLYEQDTAGGFPEFAIYVRNGKFDVIFNGGANHLTPTNVIADGRWHHMILAREGDGLHWHLYLDGAQIGTFTDVAAQTLVGPKQGFGGSFSDAGSFIGGLDEAAIYRAELNATKAAKHRQAGQYYWPGEPSGDRIGRVLDNVGWPAGDRSLDTGTATLQNRVTDLTGSSALEHAQLVEKSEAGLLYQDADGKIVFIERNATLLPPFTVSQATFGDGPGELPYDPAPEMWVGDDDIISEALGARAGGLKQRSFDAGSDAKFGPSSQDLGEDLLLTDDTTVKDRLDWVIGHYKQPANRIGALRIRPVDDPTNLFPVCLGLQIGDRVTVKGRPPGGGDPFSQQGIIESIAHEMTEEGDWITTFEVGAADYVDYWVLGVSALGINTRLSY